MTSGIYAIVNPSSGKQYIGSSQNIEHRWYLHCNDISKGRHHSPLLQRAWIKHGELAFWFIIIEMVSDITQLATREQYWLDRLDTANPIHGYNIAPKAESRLGAKWSAEARARLIPIRRRVGFSPLARAKQRDAMKSGLAREMQKKTVAARKENGTYRHSEATRQKISELQRGRKASQKSRAKCRDTHKRLAAEGTARREHLRALGRARKGMTLSEEHKSKISATQKGRKGREWTPEQRAKVSATLKGRCPSNETRAKLKAAWIRRKGKHEANERTQGFTLGERLCGSGKKGASDS